MDLYERMAEAASEAITKLELKNVEYESQYHHPDSERIEVHFRERTSYFGVQILLGGHSEHLAQTNVEVLTDQIVAKLSERYAE
jgi:hypothetical protein